MGLLLIVLPLGILIGRFMRPSGAASTSPPDARVLNARETLVYEVQLGPYPDRASATDVQRAVARQWPDAWVILHDGQSFVHVLRTLYADKAERLVARFREQGYQARIRHTTRPYTP
jgi:hypothetical protein